VPLSHRPLKRRSSESHLTRIDETKVAIVDPLFADWLRRSFP
jgi:hypothetical protein